jgi:hypothetical protein
MIVAIVKDQFDAKAPANADRTPTDNNIGVSGLRPQRKISGGFGLLGSAHFLKRPVQRNIPRSRAQMHIAMATPE